MQTLSMDTCDWKKTSHSRTHLSSDFFKLRGLRHEVHLLVFSAQVLQEDLHGSHESYSCVAFAGV